MKGTFIFGIQTNINGTIGDLAKARDCIARGDYVVAQMFLLAAAEKLTGAAQWQFAATGTENAITSTDTAQIYTAAIQNTLDRATARETKPEQVETVADLRAKLRAGDARAADLVNDLISDNPNQATAWITRADIDEHADDLTDEQRAALMDYIRNDYELIDTSAEITNAQESMDELNR